jgi:hypothetical protein
MRPTTRTGIIAMAFATALAPAPEYAQTGDFTLPPNSIVPNYDRVSIGQREGLEAGAFVARTDDAAANWYNPAGLAQAAKSALTASANAFELTSLSLEGVGVSRKSTRFTPIGTLVGGVIAEPLFSTPRWRIGVSYAKPIAWTPSTLEGQLRTNVAAGREVFGYSTSASLTSSVFGAAVAYRANPRLRVGVGVGFSITDLNQDQSVSDRLIAADSAPTALRSLSTDGSTQHLLVSGGAQWQATPILSFGALVVSPGLRLGGSSTIAFQNTRLSANGTRDIAFRDDEARFEYRIPLRVVLGAALRIGAGALEADLRFHDGVSPYSLLSSEVSATLITTNPVGVPTTEPLRFAPVTNSARRVYNLGIGANYPITRAVRVHAGYFTDDSPLEDAATSLFRRVDLRGASGGLSIQIAHLSGSIGVSSSWGTASERAVGPSIGGIAAVTRVKISTVNFLYALSYAF